MYYIRGYTIKHFTTDTQTLEQNNKATNIKKMPHNVCVQPNIFGASSHAVLKRYSLTFTLGIELLINLWLIKEGDFGPFTLGIPLNLCVRRLGVDFGHVDKK
ncbi:hypothetical protein ACJX0J_031189 [Zea mays]